MLQSRDNVLRRVTLLENVVLSPRDGSGKFTKPCSYLLFGCVYTSGTRIFPVGNPTVKNSECLATRLIRILATRRIIKQCM